MEGQSNVKGLVGKNSVINKLILVHSAAAGLQGLCSRLNSAQTLFELCLSIAAPITHLTGAQNKIFLFYTALNLWPCVYICDKT